MVLITSSAGFVPVGQNQVDIKTKTTMKKTILIASAALLFASCERCYELRIKTVKTYTAPNGVWQATETDIDEETVCGMTKREIKMYEDDLEGTTVSNQGSSRVTTEVSVTILE